MWFRELRTDLKLHQLKNAGPEAVVRAAAWLGEHARGQRCCAAVVAAVDDPRPGVRPAAYAALSRLLARGEFTDPSDWRSLLRPDRGRDGNRVLLDWLAGVADWTIADHMVRAAGDAKATECRDAYLRLVFDRDPARAAQLFWKNGSSAEAGTRDAMARMVGTIRDPACVPTLVELLYSQLQWHDGFLDAAVADALVAIGKPAVEPLIRVLRVTKKSACLWAMRALGRIGDARAFDAIVPHLGARACEAIAPYVGRKPDEVAAAADALVALDRARAGECLIAAFPHAEDADARRLIAAAAARCGDRRAVPLLEKMLLAGGSWNQSGVIPALASLGGPEVVAVLVKYFRSTTCEQDRLDAAAALIGLGRLDSVPSDVLEAMTAFEDRVVTRTVTDYPGSSEKDGWSAVTHEEYDHTISRAEYRDAARAEIARRRRTPAS